MYRYSCTAKTNLFPPLPSLCLYIYNFRNLRLLCFHYDLLLPWEAKSLILLGSLWVLPACIWGLFCLWKQRLSETKKCVMGTFFINMVLYWILPAWHCHCIVLCVCCQALFIPGSAGLSALEDQKRSLWSLLKFILLGRRCACVFFSYGTQENIPSL